MHTGIKNIPVVLALFGVVIAAAFAAEGRENDPYDSGNWPGADLDLADGVCITGISIDGLGWGKLYYRQPTSGTKHVVKKGGKTAGSVLVAVSNSAADAHKALLSFLMGCTRIISRSENASLSYGDVSFGAWKENASNLEEIHLVAFTRRNVTVVIQNDAGELTAKEMRELAAKTLAAIEARPRMKTADKLHKPDVVEKPAMCTDGQPISNMLRVEASDPQDLSLYIKYESGEADCGRDENALTFTAKKAGTYSVTVTATNTINLSTSKTFSFTVE